MLLIEGCEAGQVPYPEDGRQGGVVPSRLKETNGKAVAEVTELDPFEADLLAGVLEIAADHTGVHRSAGVGHDEKLREVLRSVRLQKGYLGGRQGNHAVGRPAVPRAGPHLDIILYPVVTRDDAPHVEYLSPVINILPREIGKLPYRDSCRESKEKAYIGWAEVPPEVIHKSPLLPHGKKTELLPVLLGRVGDRPGRSRPPALLPGITEDAHKDVHGIMGGPFGCAGSQDRIPDGRHIGLRDGALVRYKWQDVLLHEDNIGGERRGPDGGLLLSFPGGIDFFEGHDGLLIEWWDFNPYPHNKGCAKIEKTSDVHIQK